MCQQVIKKKRWDQRRRHCSCSTCAPAVSQAGIGAKEPSTATARHLAGHLDSSGFIRHLARHDLHPLKRITVLQKKIGLWRYFLVLFFFIKLFSELVLLYLQTLLQIPSWLLKPCHMRSCRILISIFLSCGI